MTKIYKVFGPPGTGKTTFLLNKVDELLEGGGAPHQIGYFAFTRKAAHEARDRALERFSLNKSDLPFFRTLHSLAYSRLGIESDRIAKESDFREFGEQVGLDLSIGSSEESWAVKADHPILNVISLSRLKLTELRSEYNRSNLNVEWYQFLYIYQSYRAFLEERNLYDFTSLLELFADAKDEYYPILPTIFIDETQDLSPLQWKIVDRLVNRSDVAYLAGDDDQAIFTFAGAEVEHLLKYKGEQIVLEQSYRIPKKIHEMSAKVVSRIKYRVEKSWNPREEEGEVHFYPRLEMVDLKAEGSWMILASTNYMLNDAHAMLKGEGILFERNNVRSIGQGTVEAVYAWETLRKNRKINAAEVKEVYKLLGPGMIARGFKKFSGPEDELYGAEELVNSHGLAVDVANTPWFDALLKISQDKVIYIKAALRKGQSLMATPRYKLFTIHGAKGGEADHVVLFLDLSTKFMDEYHANPDTINRLLYVGMTRAKKTLHVIYPQDNNKAFYL
jgi:DNA helicase-2/ATP-dependent DNA helicase PcrA